MKRWVTLALLLLIIVNLAGVSTHTASPEVPTVQEIIEQMRPAVVLILESAYGKLYPRGTGFIINSKGYILTCWHVVQEVSQIVVRVNDKDDYPATVIEKDEELDIAVIKIEAEDLATVQLGDSDEIAVDHEVRVMGYPVFVTGVTPEKATVTSGRVSAIGVTATAIHTYYGTEYVLEDLIQVDAAINSGNSGGPVIYVQQGTSNYGKVIGIARAGKGMGISYVTPINIAIYSETLRLKGFLPPPPPYTVCPRGCPFATVQAALDAARSGDTITIGPGTYNENLEFTKSLTLRGMGREQTIFKGHEPGRPVVCIRDDGAIEVTLENLTISEAKPLSGRECSLEYPQWICPAGIRISGSVKVIITDTLISNNPGQGITIEDAASVTITSSQISGNADDGINVERAQLEIRDSSILDNQRCGIYVWPEEPHAEAHGSNNEMRGNGADLCGFAPATLRRPLVPQTARASLDVPSDYPTVQEAIDAIAPGGKITVAAGSYEEGLTIWKSLTLRGAGQERTTLKARHQNKLIISVIAEAEEVTLEGIKVTASQGEGVSIYGQATLQDVQVSSNGWGGISVGKWAQATISNSTISNNGGGDGIFVWNFARATVYNTTVSNNGGYGIWVGCHSQTTISDTIISGNKKTGLRIGGMQEVDSSVVKVRNSTIQGNGGHGVEVEYKTETTISDSQILDNKGWGVVAWLIKCGFNSDEFAGKVTLEDNIIKGNRKGDVCLPSGPV